MKTKCIIILSLILLFTIDTLSIEIKLKNDEIISGKLAFMKKRKYFIIDNENLIIVNKSSIKTIDPKNELERNLIFYPSRKKIVNYKLFENVIEISKNNLNGKILSAEEKIQYHYPNLKFLPISLALFTLSYDNFQSYSDLKKEIKELNENDINIPSSLKETKTRKSIVGYFCLFAGLWNATISFEKVELFIEYNQVEVNYKF